MPQPNNLSSFRARALAARKRRIARAQREAARVTDRINTQLDRDIRAMMRDNRMGGV